jgi:hypothetical protein
MVIDRRKFSFVPLSQGGIIDAMRLYEPVTNRRDFFLRFVKEKAEGIFHSCPFTKWELFRETPIPLYSSSL